MSLDQDGLHLAGIYLIQTQEGKKSLICLFVVDFREQLHHYGGDHFSANQCYQYAYGLLLTL